jgi:hypothetical protein
MADMDRISRRHALQMLSAGAIAATAPRIMRAQTTPPGRFTDERASLEAYTISDWFTDAKFGIWSLGTAYGSLHDPALTPGACAR